MSAVEMPRPGHTPGEATNGKIAQLHKTSSIEWVESDVICAPLPPTPWIARELMIAPGRPAMLAGYGSSAKTLSAQALALAVASGTPIWGHFECERGVALHVDYEQGFHATAKRYQRLMLGHGIDSTEIVGHLRLADLPSIFLSSTNAIDAYSRATEGVNLLIVDSLRAGMPGHDENDSKVREFVDVLTRVAKNTGVACVLIHHAGKTGPDKSTDARQTPRGSSGIFDAVGCALIINAGKTSADPRKVTMVKAPAEAEGGSLDPFELVVEDVDLAGDRTAGVRVIHRAIEQAAGPSSPSAKYEERASAVLTVLRGKPGCSRTYIQQHAGLGTDTLRGVLELLVEERRIVVIRGSTGTPDQYFAASPENV